MGDQTNNANPNLQSVLDVLKTGINAYVDSQNQPIYVVSDPRYNTEGGIAGTTQLGVFGGVRTTGSVNWLLIGGIALAVYLMSRR